MDPVIEPGVAGERVGDEGCACRAGVAQGGAEFIVPAGRVVLVGICGGRVDDFDVQFAELVEVIEEVEDQGGVATGLEGICFDFRTDGVGLCLLGPGL